jgi:hypothetical protein
LHEAEKRHVERKRIGRQIVAGSQEAAIATEAVLKSLERHVGQDGKGLGRIQTVLDYIDRESIEGRDGEVMRDFWSTVVDYLEKMREETVAA